MPIRMAEYAPNIRPIRRSLIVYAGNSGLDSGQINEPITSEAQFHETTQPSSQVSSNCVTQHVTDGSIREKPTHLNEVKEFSDAIDAYFSSNCDHETDTQRSGNQSIDRLPPIPSLFKSLTCYNSIALNSFRFNSMDTNSKKADETSSMKKRLLTKDCSKVEGQWIPNVAKKILSCYYSDLHIKSEFLSTQVKLDDYESLVLHEAVKAFQDIAFTNPYIEPDRALMPYEYYIELRPFEFISSCLKLRSYRKLHIEDKIKLTRSAFFDLNCVKGVVNYDKSIDGWYVTGGIIRRNQFGFSAYTQELDDLVLTFPDCLRKDMNVVALLYTIVLFNPDLSKLKFRSNISQQQYIHIYLLKRYLVSLFESECEASEYHYLLLAKLEQAMNIPDFAVYEQIQPGLTTVLRRHVADLLNLQKCNPINLH